MVLKDCTAACKDKRKIIINLGVFLQEDQFLGSSSGMGESYAVAGNECLWFPQSHWTTELKYKCRLSGSRSISPYTVEKWSCQ
jgi:hypothetical protein